LTTKTHALVDGRGRLLTVIVTPGQAGDSPVLPRLLDELRIPRRGPGRPRTTPTALRGDKAYSSRSHRHLLRRRGITAVIPERADQAGHRKLRGSAGGRPVSYDREDYKGRNVVERFFNRMKHWRGLASRYDQNALVYRGGVVLAAIIDWLRHS
jgi:transposase